MLPVAVLHDNSDQGVGCLTVVAVADVIRATPGLSRHLAKDASISIVHCAANGRDVVLACRRLAPCVLVADAALITQVDLGEFTGAADSSHTIGVLIVTDEDDPQFFQKILRMGFAGAIRRDASDAVFRRALEAVAEGELWAPRSSVAGLVRDLLSEASPRKLTSREREVLSLIGKGYKNRDIAEALFVSRETVRWHLKGIYAKLGILDRQGAIAYALSASGVGKNPPLGA